MLLLFMTLFFVSNPVFAGNKATPNEVKALVVKSCEAPLLSESEAIAELERERAIREYDEAEARVHKLRIAITEFLREEEEHIADPQILETLKSVLKYTSWGGSAAWRSGYDIRDPYTHPELSKYSELFDSIIARSKIVERLDAMDFLEDVDEALETDGFSLTPTDVSQIMVPQSKESLWARIFRRTPKIAFKDAVQFAGGLKLYPVEKRFKILRKSLKGIPLISRLEQKIIMSAFPGEDQAYVYGLLASRVVGDMTMLRVRQKAVLALKEKGGSYFRYAFDEYEIQRLISEESQLFEMLLEKYAQTAKRTNYFEDNRIEFFIDPAKVEAMRFSDPEKARLTDRLRAVLLGGESQKALPEPAKPEVKPNERLVFIFEEMETDEMKISALANFIGSAKSSALTDVDLRYIAEHIPQKTYATNKGEHLHHIVTSTIHSRGYGTFVVSEDRPQDVAILFRALQNVNSVTDLKKLKETITKIDLIVNESALWGYGEAGGAYRAAVKSVFHDEYRRIQALVK